MHSSAQPRRAPYLLWGAVIALALVATRVSLYPEHFFNWDATQLGLALDRYDLFAHQPHPPGYLFYVGLGHVVRALGARPERTFQILSTLASAVALLGIWALGRRLAGERAALLAVLASLFHPYVWSYGIVGESYAAELAAATWIGVLCVDAWRGHARAALCAGLLLGLCGGVRTSVTMFLAPLWAVALLRGAHPWRRRLASAGLAVLGVAAWLVPSAALAGGPGEYLRLTRVLTLDVVAARASPLVGSFAYGAERNVVSVLAWTFFAAAPLLAPALLALVPGTTHRASPPRPWLVLLLWALPAFAFYLLLFASKPGYVLTYYAPLAVLCAGEAAAGIERLAARWAGAGPRAGAWLTALVAAAMVGTGATLFLFASPGPDDRLGISLPHVRSADLLLRRALEVAEREERAAGPGRTAFVANLWLPDWRRFSYYHPGAPVWHLVSRETYGGLGDHADACVSLARRMRCLSWDGGGREIPLAPAVERLVLFGGHLERWLTDSFGPVRAAHRSDRGFDYTVVDVTGLVSVRAGPFRFFRSPAPAPPGSP